MRWLLLLALAGCGDKDPDTETGNTDDSGDTDTDELYDCDGASWDEEGSAEFMTHCVLPAMTAHFQEYDGTAYADFSCAACHGEDLGGGSYAMPAATPISVRQQDPSSEIYQFMSGTVVPEMAAILGKEPYDPATGQGDFSCYDCHIEAR